MVLAMTGASGAVYAVRLLEVLRGAGCEVHLVISPAAQAVLHHELGVELDLKAFRPELLDCAPGGAGGNSLASHPWLRPRGSATGSGLTREALPAPSGGPAAAVAGRGKLVYHHYLDLLAPVASGSFRTSSMVICPCSGSTLGAVVHGTGNNLIHRAAEVHLKERRKLILVPRETPLSIVQLENWHRAAQAGAVVLPASPGFYHGVESIKDLVDFVVGRICDQLQIENAIIRRWGGEP